MTNSYTAITRATILGEVGPASLDVQYGVVCKNVRVTNALADLEEKQVEQFKQTLLSSASVLANEKNNPPKDATPEALEYFSNQCGELADSLKALGRELKALETEVDHLQDVDQEAVEQFRARMAGHEADLRELVNVRVTDIETFYKGKADLDHKDFTNALRDLSIKYVQNSKQYMSVLAELVKRSDPNAPAPEKAVIEKTEPAIKPVFEKAKKTVDQRKQEQLALEISTRALSAKVVAFSSEVTALLKQLQKVLPPAATKKVSPPPAPGKTF
ncbi:MAG TPA: hypothetical protein VGU44_00400 [Gammaproteobacteria bacterium]|nr:hypothetical protein [Gammaproteobacteria bacterium]